MPGNPPAGTRLVRDERFEAHLRRVAERKRRLAETCRALFPRPVVCALEIGCGHGHFLAAYAQAHPERLFAGIDIAGRRLRRAGLKKEKRGLKNLLLVKGEAMEFLEALPQGVRLEEILILYPDPWPKKRHHKHRLVQTAFLDRLAGRSLPGAHFRLRTDHEDYFLWARGKIRSHPAWTVQTDLPWPFEHETYFQNLMQKRLSLAAVRRGGK